MKCFFMAPGATVREGAPQQGAKIGFYHVKEFSFQPEDFRKKPPRGVIDLIDAWISPSIEDDITFIVHTSSGETYKLRDVKDNIMAGENSDLSLLSIEVLIGRVEIDLDAECHLPCIVFRLLDYPAVSISYFDQWQIEQFHLYKHENNLKSWNELSDQFYELRSPSGVYEFKRGKSCLFKTYLNRLRSHLLNVPLFLLLIDQINMANVDNSSTQFVGSCTIKLDKLIENLYNSIKMHGYDTPLVEQETNYCDLFNLMGRKIGSCDLAVRLCHYGKTILTHLPMLDTDHKHVEQEKNVKNQLATNTGVTAEKPLEKQKLQPSIEISDTVVKHIEFVNEKKDVALQLSRYDFPLSMKSCAVQTQWTTTTVRQEKLTVTTTEPGDDLTVMAYRPPPLYFNSDSDWLCMKASIPSSPSSLEKAKENRLTYLASIPIASFDESKPTKHPVNVHFDLRRHEASEKSYSPTSHLPKDFLHNFPLLRSLVQEALAIQQRNIPQKKRLPLPITDRPHSADQQIKSTKRVKSPRIKSARVIVKQTDQTKRLYPLPSSQSMVSKTEIRALVDRLSKPKFNKRIEKEILLIKQTPTVEPLKSARLVNNNAQTKKPPRSTANPSYSVTRTMKLRAAHARRQSQIVAPDQTKSKQNASSPNNSTNQQQLLNTATLSLLNKVDIDSTMEKPPQKDEQAPISNIATNTSSTATSKDGSFKINTSTSTTTTTDTLNSTTLEKLNLNQQQDRKDDDILFSITDVTD
ncbi:unnamed protein product [Didymodactylos carnosus]|uniref:Uncharacterized protein n=1 Tax=Didymodactylos carnosus TaxID=1234261 RepID=A0A813UF63_9BILA|nr:unnamed protein product [Didymodactylos carnosus]CAF0825062.1 unnamed protein product [Didymodactylos carnosus]CAF3521225.1 unnamed protein product [Didymodactylos carnosus]CAF3611762.1 unnamed protein product [Didymodactylos carnosus]